MTDACRAVEGSPHSPAEQGPVGSEGAGWNVVITGGGTVAPIDEVRLIANTSTGQTAASLAEAWLARGARVWHIAAPGAQMAFDRSARFNLEADPNAEFHRLSRLRDDWLKIRDRYQPIRLARGTVADYRRRLQEVLTSQRIDAVFLAMAVSDFEPEATSGKIRSEAESLVIRCLPTPKVIRDVRDWAPNAYLVGFKLLAGVTTEELIEEARRALVVNRADLTVANDQRTVVEGKHAIHLVRSAGPVESFSWPEPIIEKLVDRTIAWAGPNRENRALN